MLFWPIVIALGPGFAALYYDHDVKAFNDQAACEKTLPDLEQKAKATKDFMDAVTDVAGDLVSLSIGIDAGLSVGTTLDIYRHEGGGRYLGTVKVTSALNLFPKNAIVTFIPARNVPFDRLRPEELPKKGDEVRPANAVTGGQ